MSPARARTVTFDLGGRTAIVTGAGRGIGKALAAELAAGGAHVLAVDVEKDVVLAAAEEIGATPMVVDVTDTEQVEAAVAQAVADTGRLDIVVNNAGNLRDNVVWKLSDDDWHSVVDVHLGGTFRFTRAAVPHFRAQRYGRIVNVTSYAGLRGSPGQANYSAAKGGIVGLTKTTAKELSRFGVTVNAISPGAKTRMIEGLPQDVQEDIASRIPLGRFAETEEIGPIVAFLSSEAASYITGAVISVDGGASM